MRRVRPESPSGARQRTPGPRSPPRAPPAWPITQQRQGPPQVGAPSPESCRCSQARPSPLRLRTGPAPACRRGRKTLKSRPETAPGDPSERTALPPRGVSTPCACVPVCVKWVTLSGELECIFPERTRPLLESQGQTATASLCRPLGLRFASPGTAVQFLSWASRSGRRAKEGKHTGLVL